MIFRGLPRRTRGFESRLDQNFFVHVISFAIFLMSQKGPPSFFKYFATEWIFKKIPKGPLTFFGTMRLTGDFFPHSGTVEENT